MLSGLIGYLRRHHVGLLALLVAMGGSAYAAGTVSSRDVVDGSLKTQDLKDGTVQGRDLEPNSLKGVHIDESTVTDRVAQAAVVGGMEPRMLENDGFSSVEYVSTGTYRMTLEQNEPRCSFGTSFIGLRPGDTSGGGSIGIIYRPDGFDVIVQDHSGNPVDLFPPGPGPFGFSVVSAC